MWDDKTSSSVYVELTGYSLRASIEDGRRETREMFEGLNAEERDALAFDAWSAGLRVVSNARRRSPEPGLQRVSTAAEPPRAPCRLSTIPPSTW